MASVNDVEMFGSDFEDDPVPTTAAKAGADDDLFGEDQKDEGS